MDLVCMVSGKSHMSSNDHPATGMSFSTNLMAKAGIVVFLSFHVASMEDFELHFVAHLRYIKENIVTSSNENFHIFVLFPMHLRFGKVLQLAYSCGLKPGIIDEAFVAITTSLINIEPAKL